MKRYHFACNRAFLASRMGDVSQLAGAKRYEYTDGSAKGIEAVDIRTGSGLEYTVLPGRGMDISRAAFCAVPLSFASKTGIVAPAHFESRGAGWLRSFYGGLITTCGLSNVGKPSEKESSLLGRQELGLHGRIANTCADNVSVREDWETDVLTITVSGRVKETTAFGECLILERKIQSVAGKNSIKITDIIENTSPYSAPVMLLYHINAGYPLLDEGAEFCAESRHIAGATPMAEDCIDRYATMPKPKTGTGEHVYYHDLIADSHNKVSAAVVNRMLELGLYIRFDKSELPYFTQWKANEEQDYAMGMEPANCLPTGFERENQEGRVEYLQPFAKKTVHLEIGVLEDTEAIDRFIEELHGAEDKHECFHCGGCKPHHESLSRR